VRLSVFGDQVPLVVTRKGGLYTTLNWAGWAKGVSHLGEELRDIECGPDGRMYYLADNPTRIIINEKEHQD